MAESTEELEPLFDYSRVQPLDIVCLDDDCSDFSPSLAVSPKRWKLSDTAVEKVDKNAKSIDVIDCEDKEEDDWLPPPPKVSSDPRKFVEDSTIKELRLKRQELASFAKAAEEVLRSVEKSAKSDFNSSLQPTVESAADQPSRPPCERAKIVISIQDKEELKQFRVYKVIFFLQKSMISSSDSSRCTPKKLSSIYKDWFFVLMGIKLVQQQRLMVLGWRMMTSLKCTSSQHDKRPKLTSCCFGSYLGILLIPFQPLCLSLLFNC
ncbi:hypothetical protein U1Q18_029613 [Sarracenia purpurea var. burkii]